LAKALGRLMENKADSYWFPAGVSVRVSVGVLGAENQRVANCI
jgi:hypothetical protein